MRHRLGEAGGVDQDVAAAEGAAHLVGGAPHGRGIFQHDAAWRDGRCRAASPITACARSRPCCSRRRRVAPSSASMRAVAAPMPLAAAGDDGDFALQLRLIRHLSSARHPWSWPGWHRAIRQHRHLRARRRRGCPMPDKLRGHDASTRGRAAHYPGKCFFSPCQPSK